MSLLLFIDTVVFEKKMKIELRRNFLMSLQHLKHSFENLYLFLSETPMDELLTVFAINSVSLWSKMNNLSHIR